MRVVLDLPSQAEEMLSLIAKERNISQENLLKEMILQYLEDLEDAQKGEQAYNEYLESGEKGTPAKEVFGKQWDKSLTVQEKKQIEQENAHFPEDSLDEL